MKGQLVGLRAAVDRVTAQLSQRPEVEDVDQAALGLGGRRTGVARVTLPPVQVEDTIVNGGIDSSAVQDKNPAALAVERRMFADQRGNVNRPVGMVMAQVSQDAGQFDGVAQAVTESEQDIPGRLLLGRRPDRGKVRGLRTDRRCLWPRKTQGFAGIVKLDAPAHVGRRDQRHAARDAQVGTDLDRLLAQVVAVLLVPIANGLAAGFPATALSTARQGSRRAEELVMRISLPVRRLPAAGDHDARPVLRQTRFGLDGSRQVHGKGHRTQYARGVVHETDEFPRRGLADQVHHIAEARVPVPLLAALDEG